MIGVDLLADAEVARLIDAHTRARAAEGFGERHRSAAVQQSIGLPGPLIHGHGAADEVVADFGEHDAEGLHHGAGPVALSASSDNTLRQMLISNP